MTTQTKRADELKVGDVYRPGHRYHWRRVISDTADCDICDACVYVLEEIIPPSQRGFRWDKNTCCEPRPSLNILGRDEPVEVLTP